MFFVHRKGKRAKRVDGKGTTGTGTGTGITELLASQSFYIYLFRGDLAVGGEAGIHWQ